MIPQFPEFKLLEITDKKEFEDFVFQFPPYSDFNFVSLWSYNTKEDCKVSYLHGNLVVGMNDYVTLDPFFMFLGNNKVKETIQLLLGLLKNENLLPVLKLIPEYNLEEEIVSLSNNFKVEEDLDSFDYILSVEKVKELKGRKFHTLRQQMQRFKEKYPNHSCNFTDIRDPAVKAEVRRLIYVWGEKRGKSQEEVENEAFSIGRLLDSAEYLNVITLFIEVDGVNTGFYIAEKIQEPYAIGHFRKADPSFKGIFELIDYEMIKKLDEYQCQFINYEQDLGIPGLRLAKKSMQPVSYLKKYTIS